MDEIIKKLKSDLIKLEIVDFFNRYYLNDDYWYFKHVLHFEDENALIEVKKFKDIISQHFKVDAENIFLVGSGKLGVSMSPPKEGLVQKLFNPFRIEGDNPSDLDLAIISENLFNYYWDLYRNAHYYPRYKNTYSHIYVETFRGFINSKNVIEIDECRKIWNENIKNLQRKLQCFYFKHEIQFRIYRNTTDFLQYHIQGLEKIRRKNGQEI